MSDIPSDDKPGFVAEKPEHCLDCYRLIRTGQISYPQLRCPDRVFTSAPAVTGVSGDHLNGLLTLTGSS